MRDRFRGIGPGSGNGNGNGNGHGNGNGNGTRTVGLDRDWIGTAKAAYVRREDGTLAFAETAPDRYAKALEERSATAFTDDEFYGALEALKP